MKKFRFRFQSVLDVRTEREEQCKRELGNLTRVRESQEQRLRNMTRERDVCEEMARKQIHSGTSVAQAALHHAYLRRMGQEIEKQGAVLTNLSKRIEEKRRELIEAAKERRIMERLLERDQKDFMMRVEKSEQAFLDELSLNRYVRTMPGREESRETA